jgi:hypothetical protein
MKLHLRFAAAFSTAAFLFSSCQKEISKPSTDELTHASQSVNAVEKLKNDELELNISGLENLGPDARYEGWVIIDGSPVSTGIFSVNNQGQLSQAIFELPAPQGKLKRATAFVLTIEPYPDNNPAPSDQHLLGGDFNESNASLSISHPAALNTNFSTASGHFLLATPTTTSTADELSGIWFINNSSGSPMAGLHLPVLPAGWRYEGWALINGRPVSTGVFMNGNMADNFSGFSGSQPGPPFPGEDFISNAPAGLSFPTNLSGGMAVISVEPYPDNSQAPFLLKPLVRMIPNPAAQHSSYAMSMNTSSFPSGMAVKKK